MCGVFALYSGPAYGQAPDRGPVDEDIEVIKIVGEAADAPSADASSFSTQIDLEQFAGEQKRLEDMLAESVGVQVRRFGGAGARAEVSIRGSSASQVVVQLDGVTLNGGRGNGVDLASIPVASLEAVEIIRGGRSLGAGSGAIGGVVNLRTRRPDFPSALVSLQAGSFGTLSTSLQRTQPGKHFDIGFGYSGFKTDGDFEFARVITEFEDGTEIKPPTQSATRINNEQEQHNGHLSVGLDLNGAGYLLAQQRFGYTLRGESGLDRLVPSPIAGQQRLAEQERYRSVSQVRLEDILLASDLHTPFGLAEASLEASLSHRYEKSAFEDPAPALGQALDDRFEDASTSLSLRPTLLMVGRAVEQRIDAEIRAQRDAIDATDQSQKVRLGVSMYLRDEIRILDRRIALAPGVRVDWNEDSDTHVVPSIGISIAPTSWLQLKANAERSFRNPSLQDLHLPNRGFISGNPDLKSERAKNYDVGFDVELGAMGPVRKLRFGASVFRSEIDNSIVWLRVSQYKVRPENTDKAKIEGVEATASIELGNYIRVSANHTEQRARVRGPDVRIPGRAERETSARIQVGRDDLLKAVVEYQHVGSISVSQSGNYTIPSRNSWNTSVALNLDPFGRRVGFDLGTRSLWLNASVENVADVAIRDTRSFPQPGRSLRMGVEALW
ncbi:MAG: vitamin B12 transporter [Myxococcota bacterium]|jgi:vitamin B12 transporter